MLAVYLAAMAFGIILIGAAAFGGHDGGGHGHGGAHEAHDASALHQSLLSNVFSLRFWTWALGAFGTTGTVLTLLGGTPAVTLGASAAVGAVSGSGASWLFRWLRRSAGGTPAGVEDFLGAEAEVVLPLRPSALGKIRLSWGGQETELVARSADETGIGSGGRVVIVRFVEGVAEVKALPWKEDP